MKDNKVLVILGILLILIICFTFSEDRGANNFSQVLQVMGSNQESYSQVVSDNLVGNVGFNFTGGYREDGSNWSIPNVIRGLLGVSY